MNLINKPFDRYFANKYVMYKSGVQGYVYVPSWLLGCVVEVFLGDVKIFDKLVVSSMGRSVLLFSSDYFGKRITINYKK